MSWDTLYSYIFQVELFTKEPSLDRCHDDGGEWRCVSLSSGRHVTVFGGPGLEPRLYPDITYYLVIERLPMHNVFKVLVPCVVIQTTALMSFCLPIASGEKVSLSVMTLVSLIVFQLMISEHLPTQSAHVPLIGNLLTHYNGVTWRSWRLKSLASRQFI